jgi:hypothetical protein
MAVELILKLGVLVALYPSLQYLAPLVGAVTAQVVMAPAYFWALPRRLFQPSANAA